MHVWERMRVQYLFGCVRERWDRLWWVVKSRVPSVWGGPAAEVGAGVVRAVRGPTRRLVSSTRGAVLR